MHQDFCHINKLFLHCYRLAPFVYFLKRYETLCRIWYHLYNFKNVKNTHRLVLLLVKLQFIFKILNSFQANIPFLSLLRRQYFHILDDISGDQQTITDLKDLYQEALTMLTHYETRYYPLSSVRQQNLLNILYELQNLPSNVGKIFFPKLHDLNNLINHINTMILQSLNM